MTGLANRIDCERQAIIPVVVLFGMRATVNAVITVWRR
jgi:hypothetical protein